MTKRFEPAEVIVYRPGVAASRIAVTKEIAAIGRGADCTVSIGDRFLSRRHAELRWTDDGWMLADCGSANGTSVNGEKIFDALAIQNGDRIQLGDVEIVFFNRLMEDDAITLVPGPPPAAGQGAKSNDQPPGPNLDRAETLSRPRPDLPTVPGPDRPTVAASFEDRPTVATPNNDKPTLARPGPTRATQVRQVSDRHSGEIERDTTISLRMDDIVTEERLLEPNAERLRLISRLAMELIEEKPLIDLFDFIVERIHRVIGPTHAAIALLADDGETFDVIRVHPKREHDLTISRTLLEEVIEEKCVLAFTDISADADLARAASIADQQITSVLCAPLLVGECVLGILYLDYRLKQGTITEGDARLAANAARLVASKLETSRLREESLAKQKMDQELETAYLVQSRLLPAAPPAVPGYRFAGKNHPIRTVSGDYFDYVVRKDGKIYFVIADVSGKGITAALVMSGLATAFDIFTREEIEPADLLGELNRTLIPNTAPSRFVTIFIGLLDPESGRITFANAGHTPPLWVRKGGVDKLVESDVVIGLFDQAAYRNHSIRLDHGDVLVLFTDGIVEAENAAEVELGFDTVRKTVREMHGADPADVVERLETLVDDHVGSKPLTDDLTLIAIRRE